MRFNLKRHAGYFIIQIYIPCMLLVALSMVSFWLNREATAERMGLGAHAAPQATAHNSTQLLVHSAHRLALAL